MLIHIGRSTAWFVRLRSCSFGVTNLLALQIRFKCCLLLLHTENWFSLLVVAVVVVVVNSLDIWTFCWRTITTGSSGLEWLTTSLLFRTKCFSGGRQRYTLYVTRNTCATSAAPPLSPYLDSYISAAGPVAFRGYLAAFIASLILMCSLSRNQPDQATTS